MVNVQDPCKWPVCVFFLTYPGIPPTPRFPDPDQCLGSSMYEMIFSPSPIFSNTLCSLQLTMPMEES